MNGSSSREATGPAYLPRPGSHPSSNAVDATGSRPRVVIVGGGFAGLAAARALRHADAAVVLIDRVNHHTFQPLLYQVATAGLSAPQIAAPIRHILRKQRNVSVMGPAGGEGGAPRAPQ